MKEIRLVSDTINRGDIDALCKWLQQDPIPRLTKGDLTIQLEWDWAEKVGTGYSVFVNSGSSAIFLTFLAYKEMLKRPLRVVVPALSWATDLSSPMILGCDVQLCDCNLTDLSCDLNMLEDIFKTFNPDILLSVAPLGLIPDMEALLQLCRDNNVRLVEDNCESMGSLIKNSMLGSFGDSSLFSLYYGHHLSSIEGGLINTNNHALYQLLLAMRSHGWSRDLGLSNQQALAKAWRIDDFSNLYAFYYEGMNLRSTDLQAFLALRMIDRLEEYALKRNINFHLYNQNIHNNELSLKERPGEMISNFAYPMVHKERSLIVRDLINSGVETRPLIAGSMAKQPIWIKKHGHQRLCNADMIHERGFYLPNHQDLTEEEIYYIADIVNNY